MQQIRTEFIESLIAYASKNDVSKEWLKTIIELLAMK